MYNISDINMMWVLSCYNAYSKRCIVVAKINVLDDKYGDDKIFFCKLKLMKMFSWCENSK